MTLKTRLIRLEAMRPTVSTDPDRLTRAEAAAGLRAWHLAWGCTEGDADALEELRHMGIADPVNFVRKTKAYMGRFYPTGCDNNKGPTP